MSDTPRTDALTQHYFPGNLRYGSVVLWANFARELERDLAQRTADVAKAKAERDEARRSACMVKARYLGSIDGFPRPTDDEIGIKARAIARGIGWDCFKEEVRP
jgi:hypothetical protein